MHQTNKLLQLSFSAQYMVVLDPQTIFPLYPFSAANQDLENKTGLFSSSFYSLDFLNTNHHSTSIGHTITTSSKVKSVPVVLRWWLLYNMFVLLPIFPCIHPNPKKSIQNPKKRFSSLHCFTHIPLVKEEQELKIERGANQTNNFLATANKKLTPYQITWANLQLSKKNCNKREKRTDVRKRIPKKKQMRKKVGNGILVQFLWLATKPKGKSR